MRSSGPVPAWSIFALPPSCWRGSRSTAWPPTGDGHLPGSPRVTSGTIGRQVCSSLLGKTSIRWRTPRLAGARCGCSGLSGGTPRSPRRNGALAAAGNFVRRHQFPRRAEETSRCAARPHRAAAPWAAVLVRSCRCCSKAGPARASYTKGATTPGQPGLRAPPGEFARYTHLDLAGAVHGIGNAREDVWKDPRALLGGCCVLPPFRPELSWGPRHHDARIDTPRLGPRPRRLDHDQAGALDVLIVAPPTKRGATCAQEQPFRRVNLSAQLGRVSSGSRRILHRRTRGPIVLYRGLVLVPYSLPTRHVVFGSMALWRIPCFDE